MKTAKLPCYYIPHGGGPCFFMDWTPPDTWLSMQIYLEGFLKRHSGQARAALVVSAHWEADPVAITAAEQPGLLYDYYGFPAHTYRLAWPAPGSPALAGRIHQLLAEAGIPAELDGDRAFDHGVFIPLKLALPEARLPTVQLSLHPSLDPETHIRLGQSLAALREEGVLIIGSGMSYHDVGALMGRRQVKDSALFDAWLRETAGLPQPQRDQRLRAWEQAPAARLCHPREEHLLPLHVIAGAAGEDAGYLDYAGTVLGVDISAFRFGETGFAA